jgi:hypothetical protein
VDISRVKTNYKDSNNSYRRKVQSIDAILVMEYDGEAHKKAVKNAKRILDESITEDISDRIIDRNQRHYKRIKTTASRLHIIDAGTDIDQLKVNYKGDNKHLFMRGEISVYYENDADEVYGQVRQLFINRIHVSLPYSKFVENRISSGRFEPYDGDLFPPRYKVKLNIGKRLEPWIEYVQEL